MDKLKLYCVAPEKDSEWVVMVAHYSAHQAKVFGYNGFPVQDSDYIDATCHLVKEVTVPDTITEPTVFVLCDGNDWICKAWGFMPEYCSGCPRYDEKRREYEGEPMEVDH